jgi:hypothetical protein
VLNERYPASRTAVIKSTRSSRKCLGNTGDVERSVVQDVRPRWQGPHFECEYRICCTACKRTACFPAISC